MAMTPLPSPSSQEQTELARAIIDDIRTTTPTLGVRGDTWALLRRIETACEGEIAKRASAVSPERTPPLEANTMELNPLPRRGVCSECNQTTASGKYITVCDECGDKAVNTITKNRTPVSISERDPLSTSAHPEDDGFDRLRLLVSDPLLKFSNAHVTLLDRLLREHHELRAALADSRSRAEILQKRLSDEISAHRETRSRAERVEQQLPGLICEMMDNSALWVVEAGQPDAGNGTVGEIIEARIAKRLAALLTPSTP